MRTRTILFLLFVVGVSFAYLINVPVPDGMTEPGKYRALAVFERVVKFIIKLTHFAHREEPYQGYYMRALRYVSIHATPSPPAEVEGSNVRSRVTEFNGVTVRLYEPISKTNTDLMPAIVYFHGGGLCIGNPDLTDDITRHIAETLDNIVVSVDYRLAPEYLAPAAFEDCFVATRYFMQHASDFGVDRGRIGVGGDSAGGLLAASVAQAIRDDPDLPDLKLQFLLYPWLQSIDLYTPSYRKYDDEFADVGIIPRWSMATYMSLAALGEVDPDVLAKIMANNHTSSEFKKTSIEYSYVDPELLPEDLRGPDKFERGRGSDHLTGDDKLWARLSPFLLDWRNSPLMRRDLSGLPPAYIVTMGFDSIRDDGIFYKARLEKAGVPVNWVNYEGGFHGILAIGNFELGQTMLNKTIEYIQNHI